MVANFGDRSLKGFCSELMLAVTSDGRESEGRLRTQKYPPTPVPAVQFDIIVE